MQAKGCCEKMVDEIYAARHIGMSISFLRQARSTGHLPGHTPGPPFFKIGRSVRYKISDLDKWLADHRHGGGATNA